MLAGDYNVIPTPADCHAPDKWEGDALYRPETHAAFRRLLNLGLTEAVATLAVTDDTTYTFWDYQGGARRKNNGIRIDHHCFRRWPPTASPISASTPTPATGKNPQTTYPSGWN